MKPARSLVPAALALLAASPALAHPGHGPQTLAAGVLHPLTGLDHTLAMLAVGVMAAQRGGKALWAWPATFVALMLAGYGLGVALPGSPLFEPGVLASVIVLGALVAAQARVPLVLGMGLIGASGLCHGYVHGAESPTGAGLAFPLGFAATTAALHGAGLVIGLTTGLATRRRVAVRTERR